MTASKRTYETMNGLRGIAAFTVMIFHMYSFFWPGTAASGYLAVDFFFVLSGFVVAGAYQAKLATGSLPVKEFAAKRWIRFYPLYLVGLALGTVLTVAENLLHLGNAIPLGSIGPALFFALAFLPAAGPGILYITPLNGPSWSLIFEFWVNIAWALSRRASIAVYLMLLFLSGAFFIWAAAIKGDVGLGTVWETFPGGIARTIFSFTAGTLIYRVRGGAHGRPTAWSILLLVALFVLLFFRPSPTSRLLYDLTFAVVLSPLIVFFASTMEPPAPARRTFALLGDLSFPLYAIHVPIIAAGIVVMRRLPIPAAAGGIVVILGAAVAAWIVGQVDIAVRAWLQRRQHISRRENR